MKKTIVILAILLCIGFSSCENPASNGTRVPSGYKVIIEITAGSSVYANARVYDETDTFVPDAVISVDGVKLVKKEYDNYFESLETFWSDGSSHTFSVSTPDGGRSNGTVTKPTGTLSGVSYDPPKPTLAESYTATPPAGGWPVGSYLFCRFENDEHNYGIYKAPTGDSAVTFTSPYLNGATSVAFESMLRNIVTIEGYGSGSTVSVTGTRTSW